MISTHTLTWSVTHSICEEFKDKIDFNSHAHVERDWSVAMVHTAVGISTHTLTWSVTSAYAGDKRL